MGLLACPAARPPHLSEGLVGHTLNRNSTKFRHKHTSSLGVMTTDLCDQTRSRSASEQPPPVRDAETWIAVLGGLEREG